MFDLAAAMTRARPVNVTATPTLVRGAIGGSDRLNFWRFRLSNRSRLIVNLTGLRAATDTALLDDRGAPVRQMRSRGQLNRAIATDLEPGTYYLRINSRPNRSQYQLEFSARQIQLL